MSDFYHENITWPYEIWAQDRMVGAWSCVRLAPERKRFEELALAAFEQAARDKGMVIEEGSIAFADGTFAYPPGLYMGDWPPVKRDPNGYGQRFGRCYLTHAGSV